MRWTVTGALAVAQLTAREALRGRLWLPVVGAALIMAVVALRLDGVDAEARRKLSVALVVGSAGFIAHLLAVLVAAQGVRRDLEGRMALLLFAKPLPRFGYLLGRWLGGMAAVGAALAALAGIGLGIIAWRSDLPVSRSAIPADAWWRLTAAGAAEPIAAGQDLVQVSGAAGNGVRLRFGAMPDGDGEILLRAAVLGTEAAPVTQCAVRIDALDASGGARPLALAAGSPYGQASGDRPGVAVLRDHGEERRELDTDYVRVRVDAAARAADGSLTIRVTRLDSAAALRFAVADGALIAVESGGFALNLARATLAMLAAAAPLVAWTLVCACVSNLGVALLGGLTLLFTGSALPVLAETLAHEEAAAPLRRIFSVLSWIVPDFDRHHLAARLAATRAVEWAAVGDAALYYGAYAALFLGLAWWALATREVA
ncbi:MAG TPA: hypothetical protein VEL07_21010 [Planctomycetota bacterium]|nr:hypothetical protein [Planctomycetota bacterium]